MDLWILIVYQQIMSLFKYKCLCYSNLRDQLQKSPKKLCSSVVFDELYS